MDILGIIDAKDTIDFEIFGRLNYNAQYFPFYSKNDRVTPERLNQVEMFLSQSTNVGREAMIYVHIPYCLSICKFCQCDRILLPKGKCGKILDDYLEKVFKEIEYYSQKKYIQGLNCLHVHIGGGSPSLLSEEQLKRLFDKIRKEFNLSTNVRWYFEGEARSLAKESKLKTLKELGVGRISFGVQSFDPKVRELCNLKPTMSQLYNLIEMLKGLSMDVNIDMLYGLPAQDFDVLRNDLQLINKLQIDSVDYYRNLVYSNLPVYRQLRHSYPEMLDEKRKFEMFATIVDVLSPMGYSAVTDEVFCKDITKIAAVKQLPCRSGDERIDIIGIGYGSFSCLGNYYLRNMHEPGYSEFLDKNMGPYIRIHEMTLDEEYTFMGIKGLGCGLKLSMNDSHYSGFQNKYKALLEYLLEKEYIQNNNQTIEMTKKGLLHHYMVQMSFLSEKELDRSKKFSYDNIWKDSNLRI